MKKLEKVKKIIKIFYLSVLRLLDLDPHMINRYPRYRSKRKKLFRSDNGFTTLVETPPERLGSYLF